MSKPAKQINIYDAKTQFSSLVDKASKGESFIIAKAGTPMAKLVPLSEGAEPKKKFKFGTMKGKIHVPDDFDAPLPDEVLDLFYRGGFDSE
ncbi:MAG: type II toxin-antitoxin system prevent-host-death family antitoxin [Bauldia sp.]